MNTKTYQWSNAVTCNTCQATNTYFVRLKYYPHDGGPVRISLWRKCMECHREYRRLCNTRRSGGKEQWNLLARVYRAKHIERVRAIERASKQRARNRRRQMRMMEKNREVNLWRSLK